MKNGNYVGKTAIHNVIKGYSKYCRGYKFYYA